MDKMRVIRRTQYEFSIMMKSSCWKRTSGETVEHQQNPVVRAAWASLQKTHFEVWQRLYQDRESDDPITVRLQLKEHAALCGME